jgi:hypothetical protein
VVVPTADHDAIMGAAAALVDRFAQFLLAAGDPS